MEKIRSKKVLLVDDDNIIREVCTELLNLEGYSVETAINGLDALDKLRMEVYDAIMLDINMPELDGIEFCRRAIQEHPYLKDRLIFISGDLYGELDALATFLSDVDKMVLKKPFRKEELLNILKLISSRGH